MPRRTNATKFTLAFGERMRGLRRKLGMSLPELARKTGISKGHLSSIEQGFVGITVDTLYCIADGLDLPPFLLVAFPEDEYTVLLDLIWELPPSKRREFQKDLKRWVKEHEATS